jgi:hypothetical protein
MGGRDLPPPFLTSAIATVPTGTQVPMLCSLCSCDRVTVRHQLFICLRRSIIVFTRAHQMIPPYPAPMRSTCPAQLAQRLRHCRISQRCVSSNTIKHSTMRQEFQSSWIRTPLKNGAFAVFSWLSPLRVPALSKIKKKMSERTQNFPYIPDIQCNVAFF